MRDSVQSESRLFIAIIVILRLAEGSLSAGVSVFNAKFFTALYTEVF